LLPQLLLLLFLRRLGPISNFYFTITILYPYHNLRHPIVTIILRLHYHYLALSLLLPLLRIPWWESHFWQNNNNNSKWPNTSTNVVCWRRRGYQGSTNLTTQSPSVLSPNSSFRQCFIYFIVRKVNLKLFSSWNVSYFA